MKIRETDISGLVVIEPDVFGDSRGYFMESFSCRKFRELTGCDIEFVQDNESKSSYGVVRGLHFQRPPHSQSKLVRVVSGRVLDVAVDLREGSPTYGKHHTVELSGENHLQMFIPKGFAHGVAIIEDDTEYTYKVDAPYNGDLGYSGGLSVFYDPGQLNWDELLPDTELILSGKDRTGLSPSPEEADSGIYYEE